VRLLIWTFETGAGSARLEVGVPDGLDPVDAFEALSIEARGSETLDQFVELAAGVLKEHGIMLAGLRRSASITPGLKAQVRGCAQERDVFEAARLLRTAVEGATPSELEALRVDAAWLPEREYVLSLLIGMDEHGLELATWLSSRGIVVERFENG